jgi:katanin p60 ATPase-containing subunit A1
MLPYIRNINRSLILWFLFHQILVPLPEAEARHAMFEGLLPSMTSSLEIPYETLVEKTEGYSGSDIRLVCKEAAMQPLRRLMSVLDASDEVVPEEG